MQAPEQVSRASKIWPAHAPSSKALPQWRTLLAMQARKQLVAKECAWLHAITTMLVPALMAALGLGSARPPGRQAVLLNASHHSID